MGKIKISVEKSKVSVEKIRISVEEIRISVEEIKISVKKENSVENKDMVAEEGKMTIFLGYLSFRKKFQKVLEIREFLERKCQNRKDQAKLRE